ncbi:MAG: hypothetical protein GOMPHAMPRED_005714 [Gomphillus americanus]|uniref:Malate dehydrogenase n=1 Tax=Gomphillus americanus TaxID=1940652 RepID=A0A8H3IRK7_9LECA|nr:MAG: hypothetical protein GOMPHAMPRED_005714 [Gomphillus americanus]
MPSILRLYVAILAISINPGFAAAIAFRKTPGDPIPSTALLSAYAPPLSNGTASLPELNKPLRVITVGRGLQNYTCASSNSTDKPVAIGAIATLFNLDSLLSYFAPAEGQAFLNQIPAFMLSLPREAVDKSIIPQAGLHYFDASGTPTFNLSESNNGFLVGNKTGDIRAPSNSVRGAYGAVDWLSLEAKPGSQNLSRVYRTMTAAGSPPTSCEGQQASVISIEYAALYYFVSA